ncbi:D-alanyl-lipoteichoic acid biosynthesis protein DltD [Limosilactobacillus sp.]|jgi:D-alanine transfer protein|uniref:D-alanyl-lipoteichoic acid biosynthesis protein DltD n=1 Tax=Limosilactobacillus sp. TaxID=2773925 RepID=UPI0025BB417A|nr:D-alanyl-lipoteichoic acid biosynthesis protein DltD [Limosilactobacillus sp.]MCH3921628.1 D-alanyl-lipoteichoic acid biosynthesis protein DltD [Limosilactobacillus sp.]MCH3928399.1 D-alanyl-lipoteichoic acid biosynthesis protein DltD [Limosilactobacillus sp.]
MHNGKRLWSIFGPVILAFVLVLILFFLPIKANHSLNTEKQAAVSLSPTVFKNQSLKTQALTDKRTKFVPFFGSSEFRRMDRYHPSVMAARYHDYTPFLFGSRGTQSLPQFFNINSMENAMQGQKAVYIISPQWFTKQGVMKPAFQYYNGSYANLTWLRHANPKSPYDRYVARRLLKLVGDDGTVGEGARKIAAGKALNSWDRTVINMRITMLAHEDALFSDYQINRNYQNHILPNVNKLPKKYDYHRLTAQAERVGKRDSGNNPFGIRNAFFEKRVKSHLKKMAGSQRKFSYTASPEYGDLQVVLNQFKNTNSNVLFVIPPVNAKWEKFTGLNMNMYYRSVAKIKFQLRQQGFTHILDLSHDGNKPAFMEDTIHIGWAGWVKFDHETNRFISQKQPQPSYRMNDQFLSKRWANLNPTKQNLQNFKKQELQK